MKSPADAKRRKLGLQEGELVLLHIQSYKQCSLAKSKYEKLTTQFFGPYKVLRKIGPVDYEL